MDILRTIIQGYATLNQTPPPPTVKAESNLDMFLSSVVQGASKRTYSNVAPHSFYHSPIDENDGRLSGYSRNWGDASSNTQIGVMKTILEESKNLPTEDRAILLGIAKLESGFNPDAAATNTSASGVFQFIKSTGKAYGLDDANRFDTTSNVRAGVRHYIDNLKVVNRRFPGLSGDQRATMIYAFHHDGPSLKYGGQKIAEEKLIPSLERFRNLVGSE